MLIQLQTGDLFSCYFSLVIVACVVFAMCRNDWGALILVDERFGKNPNKYVKGMCCAPNWYVQKYLTIDITSNCIFVF